MDPRVVDLYEDGTTVAASVVRADHDSADERQAALERAVLRLLKEDAASSGRAARRRAA